MSRYSLGIDIGGTFTDIVVYDHRTGRQSSHKSLTTHDDPARAAMQAFDAVLARDGLPARDVGRVVHATTLFTNALIERKGAVTGLITTAGFRDIVEIGRERKYDLYDIAIARPEPLAPRRLRLEVNERVKVDGSVLTPLDETGLADAVDTLLAAGAESLAVVFLHAYRNPDNEVRARDLIADRHPALPVSISSDVAPEIREYERASTTLVNAYIKPLAAHYLDHMAAEIAQRDVPAPLFPMLSNGGLSGLDEAKRTPVQLLESGPAAGALAAAHLGREDGGDRLLAFDMGGTTAKLSVIDDGQPLIAYQFEAARQKRFMEGSGLPLRLSTVELIEIGAGGGSIARQDEIGLLKVGPDSAGSEPGPAAYGRGGTAPTVTDADFLLGYLNPDFFAGGTLAIDMPACRAAVARLAERTGMTPEALAWGIHDVVNENMASAARVHIAERGRSPVDYTLLPTGGAGPVHAYGLARKLGLKRIVCPPAAGVASALGLLVAPARVDRVATVAMPLDGADWAGLEATFRRLEDEARAVIARTGLDPAQAEVARSSDMRYVGQAYELVVPLPQGPYAASSRDALLAAFEAHYREHFARTPPAMPIEFVNLRVRVQAPIAAPDAAAGMAVADAAALKGERPAYIPDGGLRPVPVYDRYALKPGDSFAGPAIVEERESTLIVGPEGRFTVAATGSIVIDMEETA